MKEYHVIFARYSSLFFSVLVFVIMTGMEIARPVPTLLVSALIGCAGVFVAVSIRLYAGIALFLAVSWNALAWTERFMLDITAILFAKFAAAMAFFTFLTFLVLRHLFRARKVGADLLFGAGAAYLMLGMFFAFIYQVAILINPTCIAFPDGDGGFSLLLYYSFTTLTTLGYGDVTPVTPVMRTTAILEASIGVFFTAILVGRLMGLYLVGMGQTEKK
jgi:hypothetical protein